MPSFHVEGYLRQALDDIWNRKMVGRLYGCAAAGIVVHGPSGQELVGREEAIGDVLRWLAAFPDTRLEIEAVIWSGDDGRGFLASVRQHRTGTNLGASIYGPATGCAVTSGVIVHYFIHDGLIREVWQAYDELGLVEQLGLDLSEVQQRLDIWRPLAGAEPFGVGEIRRTEGQLPPPLMAPAATNSLDAEYLVRHGLHAIWNRRLVGQIEQVYHPELRWQLGDLHTAGREGLAAHVLARLAAFPDLCLHVDQLMCQGDETAGYATSIAWTLLGTHTGPGLYGLPTGRRIRLHGLTQQRIEAGQVVQEWTRGNELGLLRQLHEDLLCSPSTEAFTARATSPS